MILCCWKIYFFILFIKAFSIKLAQSNKIFIIAAHNENISWLEPIANETIIFNKGNPLNNSTLADLFLDIRALSNVGRESHSYLTYIIENYYNLPEIVTFSQARITDHGYKYPLDALKIMSEEAEIFGCSKNFKTGNIRKNFGLTEVKVCPFKDYETIGAFVKHFFGKEDDYYKFFSNGVFSVRSDKILSRPKQFYMDLIKTLEHHNNPREGHFFERSWYLIFNCY
jgi:hypothetical protein